MSAAEQHDWLRSATSRRSLLRAGAIGAGAALAGPALLAGTADASTRRASAKKTPHLLTRADGPRGSAIAPFGRHIAYGADPTSQMAVAWQVAASINNPFIRIGHSPLDLSHRIPAEVRTVTTPASVWNTSTASPDDSIPPSLASAAIDQYYLHATLSGLRPGQTYYYSVGHDGWDFSGNVATLGSFTTAPDRREPFRFTAFGDMGWTYDSVGTVTQVRTQNPAFHLHAGDISYAENGGSGLLTDQYDPRVWDNWFNLVEPAAGSLPWQIAIGNHEMEVWYSPDTYGAQYSRWDFPGEATSSTPPVYYSFTYGNVGFVSLDANDVSYEIPANLGYSGGAQVTWLGTTLAALRANPQINFIVVYFHHCAYCTCSTHGSDGGVDKYFTPLFDQYTVDLVINGHNHIYERTDPIIGGSSTQQAPIGTVLNNSGSSPAGTTYITAGAAGKSLYSFDGNSATPGIIPDSYLGNINNDSAVPTYINSDPTTGAVTNDTVNWSRVRYTGYCLLVVDSEPGWGGGNSKLKITGLSENGTELDYLEIVR
jgi:Purple acid Phosphatase, N-terminal domain/Calcineurin-like phosphoesterase